MNRSATKRLNTLKPQHLLGLFVLDGDMKNVLMSANNPNGFKLEELLKQLQVEVVEKTARVANDTSELAEQVKGNNRKIIQLLSEAERLQRESFALMAAKAPDCGPLGSPRIGK
jgi:hypothetical protein